MLILLNIWRFIFVLIMYQIATYPIFILHIGSIVVSSFWRWCFFLMYHDTAFVALNTTCVYQTRLSRKLNISSSHITKSDFFNTSWYHLQNKEVVKGKWFNVRSYFGGGACEEFTSWGTNQTNASDKYWSRSCESGKQVRPAHK